MFFNSSQVKEREDEQRLILSVEKDKGVKCHCITLYGNSGSLMPLSFSTDDMLRIQSFIVDNDAISLTPLWGSGGGGRVEEVISAPLRNAKYQIKVMSTPLSIISPASHGLGVCC